MLTSQVSRRGERVFMFRGLGASEDRSAAEILGGRLSLRGRVGNRSVCQTMFEPRVGLIAGVRRWKTRPSLKRHGGGRGGGSSIIGRDVELQGLQGCFRPLFYDFVYLESSECSVVGSFSIILHCSAFSQGVN